MPPFSPTLPQSPVPTDPACQSSAQSPLPTDRLALCPLHISQAVEKEAPPHAISAAEIKENKSISCVLNRHALETAVLSAIQAERLEIASEIAASSVTTASVTGSRERPASPGLELEADEVLLIAPANARAVSSGPGPAAAVAAPAGRHLLVVGDEVEVVLIRPVVPDILFPLDSSPE